MEVIRIINQIQGKKSTNQKILSSYFINKNGWITNLVLQNTFTRDARIDVFFYDNAGNPMKVYRDVMIPGNGVHILPAKLYMADLPFGTIKVVVLEGRVIGNTIKIDLKTETIFSDPLQ